MHSALNPQWDARAHLGGTLDRQVGVLIGQPFLHHGLNALYADVSRETPRLVTDVYGTCYPVAETEQHARSAFEKTIAELDALITHLAKHRDRLAADLASLPHRDFLQQVTPRDDSDPAPVKPQIPTVVDVSLPPVD